MCCSQDNIIAVLSHSEGNILENEDAINVISSSKTLSNDIQAKQQVAERTEKKIDEARAGYKPVAQISSPLTAPSFVTLCNPFHKQIIVFASSDMNIQRLRMVHSRMHRVPRARLLNLKGHCLTTLRWYRVQVVSVLFFVISELAGVEPMYQYSLAWFVGLFEATLIQAEKARDLHKRIDNLIAHFQYSLYLKVSRICLLIVSVSRFTPLVGRKASVCNSLLVKRV